MATVTNSSTDVTRAIPGPPRDKPVLLGIVGDSAAGKTTMTRGIANVFGTDRVTHVCSDDYHRYDREARKEMSITPLNPECNYVDIMEQHLKLLAAGEPILKPVYQHADGTLGAPELVHPRELVVVEGLLGFHTKAMRDCYDVKVYLDPPEDLRRQWKIDRDTSKRGYESDQVIADLEKREPDSEAYIRPQRELADIVVRFHPPGASLDVAPDALNVRLVLRPTLAHPYLIDIAERARVDQFRPIRISLARDRGKPVDVVEVDGSVDPELSANVERLILEGMSIDAKHVDRSTIGSFQVGDETLRSESLALTQLLLVVQLLSAKVAT
ncbi:MAG: phosphoribulokinase [Actinomycetota bacterium]